MQPPAHRGLGAAKAYRRLGVVEPLAVNQHHGVVKFLRQPVEQLPDTLGGRRRVGWGIGVKGGGLNGEGLVLEALLPRLPEEILGGVDDDAVGPGGKTVFAVKLVQGAGDFEQRLLDDVLGVVSAAAVLAGKGKVTDP